jgi:uncharacterized protein (TIRG00374 family)
LKKTIFKVLRFLIFLSIGLVLLYLAFRGVNFDLLWEQFKNARYGFILLYLLFGFISLMSRAYRWNMLIEPLGHKPAFLSSFYSLNIGYMANYAFPRIGEITRCGTLSKAEKIPVDKLFGTVIMERVTDLFMVFILLLILIIGRLDFFGTFIKNNIFLPLFEKLNSTIGGALVLILVIAGTPILLLITYLLFRRRLAGIRIIQKLKSVVWGIIDGLKSIYQMKKRWGFVLQSTIIWGSYWLMTYAALFALPATSELQLIDALFLLVVGSFGFIVPVQGGIGAYHYVVVLGLTLYAVPREEGLTYATLTHGSQMIMLIVLGLISLMLMFAVQKKARSVLNASGSNIENEIH